MRGERVKRWKMSKLLSDLKYFLHYSMDVRSPAGSVHSNSSSKSATSKRNRFLLKRQDCLSENKGFDNELDLTITPTTVHNRGCLKKK